MKRTYFLVENKKREGYILVDADCEYYCKKFDDNTSVKKVLVKFAKVLENKGCKAIVDDINSMIENDEITCYNNISEGGGAFEVEINKNYSGDATIYIRVATPIEETTEATETTEELEKTIEISVETETTETETTEAPATTETTEAPCTGNCSSCIGCKKEATPATPATGMRRILIDPNFKIESKKSKKKKLYGICKHVDDGKLACMYSYNTCSLNNSFCEKMSKIKGTVCEKCFARRQLKHRKNQVVNYTTEILERVYNWDEIPFIYETGNPYNIIRIESFGELHDVSEGGLNQTMNYINLIRKNPHVNFGWWTKRPDIIDKTLKLFNIEIPQNVNVIYSNPYLNGCYASGKKYNVQKVVDKHSFIKGVFTVYNLEYAVKHDIKINCGGSKCVMCLNCYNCYNEVFYINELLKDDQAKTRSKRSK